MINLFCLIIFTWLSLSVSVPAFSRTEEKLYPIWDSPLEETIPRNWRSTEPVKIKDSSSSINLSGFEDLHASGSGQFSEGAFKEMVRYLPEDVSQLVVIDLREESHGLINGKPVSWTDGANRANLQKTSVEIELDERLLLFQAIEEGTIAILSEDKEIVTVEKIVTERDFVESLGCDYIRLPVTDHGLPPDKMVDFFIQFVKEMPEDSWIHFHCKAGKGRTTSFLILFDIMVNAQQVSLEDILDRQKFIGGSDMKGNPQKEQFMTRFYTYCLEVPDFSLSWSEWSHLNP